MMHFHNPVDISGTVVGESPDCLLLSGTVVGENPDWESAGNYNKVHVLYGNHILVCI